MLTLIALVLALTVIPSPWGWITVLVAAAVDILEWVAFAWWSKRRRPSVGVEALVGSDAEVVDGSYVRVAGELWQARGLEGRSPGERVRIRAVDGLVLEIE